MPAGAGAVTQPAIAPHVLEQAAEWLVRLHDADATDDDRAACARWRASDPEHARAWERAERLMDKLRGKLDGLPPELARAALDHAAPRRAAIGRIVAALAVAPVAWGAWRLVEQNQWTADERTAPGQQRTVTLADNTVVTLNTDSALDVRYAASERLLVLRQGEMLVASGKDAAGRPLRVRTAQGRMEALGTKFTVRRHEDRTDIAVLEGAVRIEPALGEALVLPAGRQTQFTGSHVAPPAAIDPAGTAWTHGMLLADGMRLDTLAAELQRYRRGVLRVAPPIASLRVSGAFPVAQPARTLAMLAQTYPVDVHARWNGWWVELAPRR